MPTFTDHTLGGEVHHKGGFNFMHQCSYFGQMFVQVKWVELEVGMVMPLIWQKRINGFMRSAGAQYSVTLLQSKVSKGGARKGIATND
jgi:hypothetical protein